MHKRKENDFYPTDKRIILGLKVLLEKNGFLLGHHTIFNPTAGENVFSGVLGKERCVTNELFPENFPNQEYDFTLNCLDPKLWSEVSKPDKPDWVIDNPPYGGNIPDRLLPLAWEHCKVGIALHLRLSILEPTRLRREFMLENADHLRFIQPINPRCKFAFNGNEAMTTCSFVWLKEFSWSALGLESPYSPLVNWKN